ncbi:hypothetical protein N1851_002984 [Merluccius polli]|uniref:Uncharacterized protein n=1 Tax=Merluccius polli TaxID=89951 RepID=A0AA47PCM8_MERPO|nr:hypothetical protein N1851_002984 [Merluccius polli]
MAIASASLAIPCLLSCNSATNGTSSPSSAPPHSPVEAEKAAATIQNHFRRFQEKKQQNK